MTLFRTAMLITLFATALPGCRRDDAVRATSGDSNKQDTEITVEVPSHKQRGIADSGRKEAAVSRRGLETPPGQTPPSAATNPFTTVTAETAAGISPTDDPGISVAPPPLDQADRFTSGTPFNLLDKEAVIQAEGEVALVSPQELRIFYRMPGMISLAKQSTVIVQVEGQSKVLSAVPADDGEYMVVTLPEPVTPPVKFTIHFSSQGLPGFARTFTIDRIIPDSMGYRT